MLEELVTKFIFYRLFFGNLKRFLMFAKILCRFCSVFQKLILQVHMVLKNVILLIVKFI